MAADSLITCHDYRFSEAVKIARDSQGNLLGCSGHDHKAQSFLMRFMEYKGSPLTRHEGFVYSEGRALLAMPDGKLFTYETEGWTQAIAPYLAIGVAFECAMGAMDAGADAVQAVRITCYRSVYCDYPIRSIRHDTAGMEVTQHG